MSELHGYGICIDDVIKSNDPKRIIRSKEDLEPLKRLISMAPKFAADHTMATLNAMEEEILEWEYDCNLSHVASNLMERMFADDAGGTGLSYILTLVIAECEDVHMTAILDENCYEYLLFEKRYPWKLTEKEKALTEEDVVNIFRKYVGVLGSDPAEIKHTTIYLED